MLNDQRTSYRWQDHVVTPRRATFNLLATLVLIVAAVGAAGLAGHTPAPVAHARVTMEQTPSLAQSAKRLVPPHARSEALKGC